MAVTILGNIRGPQGPQGLQGPQGPQGPQGLGYDYIDVPKSVKDFMSIEQVIKYIYDNIRTAKSFTFNCDYGKYLGIIYEDEGQMGYNTKIFLHSLSDATYINATVNGYLKEYEPQATVSYTYDTFSRPCYIKLTTKDNKITAYFTILKDVYAPLVKYVLSDYMPIPLPATGTAILSDNTVVKIISISCDTSSNETRYDFEYITNSAKPEPVSAYESAIDIREV